MNQYQLSLSEKKIESALSAAGAKIADATDLSVKSIALLIEVQDSISDLYISLSDLLGAPNPSDDAK